MLFNGIPMLYHYLLLLNDVYTCLKNNYYYFYYFYYYFIKITFSIYNLIMYALIIIMPFIKYHIVYIFVSYIYNFIRVPNMINIIINNFNIILFIFNTHINVTSIDYNSFLNICYIHNHKKNIYLLFLHMLNNDFLIVLY